MTSFVTPSFCSRFGIAVLLVALADFFFYGQPVGITVLLFAILTAGAVVAVHPSALNSARPWLKPAALFVALLPLAENVSALSVTIALVALVCLHCRWPGGCGTALPALPGRSRCSCWRRRCVLSVTSSAGGGRCAAWAAAASASRL